MKIYTKTGDKGTTALFGGSRVPKHHIRIESYGTVDELNSHLGLLRDLSGDPDLNKHIIHIQNQLFTIGSTLATDPKRATLKNGKQRLNISKIAADDITHLELEMDKMNEQLPAMEHFVLPGGHPAVSTCHIARCVCRRAERLATALHENEPFDEKVLQYLNRLSDFLFVVARKLTQNFEAKEIQWIPEKELE